MAEMNSGTLLSHDLLRKKNFTYHHTVSETVTINNVTNTSTTIDTEVVRGRTGYQKVDYKEKVELRPVWEVEASEAHTETENLLKAIIAKRRALASAQDRMPPAPRKTIDELNGDLENLVKQRRELSLRLSRLLGEYKYGDLKGPGKEKEARTIRTLLHDYVLCDLPQFSEQIGGENCKKLVSELSELHFRVAMLGKLPEFSIMLNRLMSFISANYANIDLKKSQEIQQREFNNVLTLVKSAIFGGRLFEIQVAKDICPIGGFGDLLPILWDLRRMSLEMDGDKGWRGECLQYYKHVPPTPEVDELLCELTERKGRVEKLSKDLIDNCTLDENQDSSKLKGKIKNIVAYLNPQKLFNHGNPKIDFLLSKEQVVKLLGRKVVDYDINLALFFDEQAKLFQAELNLLEEPYNRPFQQAADELVEILQPLGAICPELTPILAKPPLRWTEIEIAQVLQTASRISADVLNGNDSDLIQCLNLHDPLRRQEFKERFQILKDFHTNRTTARNAGNARGESNRTALDLVKLISSCLEARNSCFNDDARTTLKNIGGKEFANWNEEDWEDVRRMYDLNIVSVSQFVQYFEHLNKISGAFKAKWNNTYENHVEVKKPGIGSRFYSPTNFPVSLRKHLDRQYVQDEENIVPSSIVKLSTQLPISDPSKYLNHPLLARLAHVLSNKESRYQLLLDTPPLGLTLDYVRHHGLDLNSDKLINLIMSRREPSDEPLDMVIGKSLAKKKEPLTAEELKIMAEVENYVERNAWRIDYMWQQLVMEMTLSLYPTEDLGQIASDETKIPKMNGIRANVRCELLEHGCTEELLEEMKFDLTFDNITKIWTMDKNNRQEKYEYLIKLANELHSGLPEEGGKGDPLKTDKTKNTARMISSLLTADSEVAPVKQLSMRQFSRLMLNFKQDDFFYINGNEIFRVDGGVKFAGIGLTAKSDTYCKIREVMVDRQGDCVRVRAYSGFGQKVSGGVSWSPVPTITMDGNVGGRIRQWDGTQILFDPETFPGGYVEMCQAVSEFLYDVQINNKIDAKFILKHSKRMGSFSQIQEDQSTSGGAAWEAKTGITAGDFRLGAGVKVKISGEVGRGSKVRTIREKDKEQNTLYVIRASVKGELSGKVDCKILPYFNPKKIDFEISNGKVNTALVMQKAGLADYYAAICSNGRSVSSEFYHLTYSIFGTIVDPHCQNKVKSAYLLRVKFHEPTVGKLDPREIYRNELKSLASLMPSTIKAIDNGEYDAKIDAFIKAVAGRDTGRGSYLAIEGALKRECQLRVDRLSAELELLAIGGLRTEEDKRKAKKLSKEIDKIVKENDNFYIVNMHLNSLHETSGEKEIRTGVDLALAFGVEGYAGGGSAYAHTQWHENWLSIARLNMNERNYEYNYKTLDQQVEEIDKKRKIESKRKKEIEERKELRRREALEKEMKTKLGRFKKAIGWNKLRGRHYEQLNTEYSFSDSKVNVIDVT